MKIVGISVQHELYRDVKIVKVTGEFNAKEELTQDDVARLFDQLQEAAGADKPVLASGSLQDTHGEYAGEGSIGASASRRRRHVNPLGDGETGEKPDPTEAAPTGRRRRSTADTPSPADASDASEPSTGRRRRASGDASPAETNTSAETGAPSARTSRRRARSDAGSAEPTEQLNTAAASAETGQTGSRRRRRTVEDAADEKAQREPAPTQPASNAEGTGRRRRTAASTAEAVSHSDGDDEITDVDLTRAASNAAAKISNAKVKELLESYDATRVSEIFQAHRKRFLRELGELVKKES